MRKIKLIQMHMMRIVVTSYECNASGDYSTATLYDESLHKKPGKTLHQIVKDYIHELRMDDEYYYKSFTVSFGKNTTVHITGYNGILTKHVLATVVRCTGYDYMMDKHTFNTQHVYSYFEDK